MTERPTPERLAAIRAHLEGVFKAHEFWGGEPNEPQLVVRDLLAEIDALQAKRATFNVNSAVWIRLTDHGRRVYEAEQRRLLAGAPDLRDSWKPRPEQDGWSEWALWSVMQEFGPHVSMAGPLLFENEIRLEKP